jgi:hypothetical protein
MVRKRSLPPQFDTLQSFGALLQSLKKARSAAHDVLDAPDASGFLSNPTPLRRRSLSSKEAARTWHLS